MAFGVKVVVLILGAGGLAGMWEAVFADVGVALLAILNAVRIQRMNFLRVEEAEELEEAGETGKARLRPR
jgi:cation transport ATPase